MKHCDIPIVIMCDNVDKSVSESCARKSRRINGWSEGGEGKESINIPFYGA